MLWFMWWKHSEFVLKSQSVFVLIWTWSSSNRVVQPCCWTLVSHWLHFSQCTDPTPSPPYVVTFSCFLRSYHRARPWRQRRPCPTAPRLLPGHCHVVWNQGKTTQARVLTDMWEQRVMDKNHVFSRPQTSFCLHDVAFFRHSSQVSGGLQEHPLISVPSCLFHHYILPP